MYGITLDRKGIQQLLLDFHILTGIRIGFFDYQLQENIAQPGTICDFCSILRENPIAHQQCIKCDELAFQISKNNGGLYIYQCHAGLTEAVSPVMIEGHLIGYLMLGQVLSHPPSPAIWKMIQQKCQHYKVKNTRLESAFYTLPSMSRDKIQAAANIMDQSAKYIHLSRLIQLQRPSLPTKIQSYIVNNLHRNITIADLSQEFHVSESHLYRIIKKEFSTNFTLYQHKLKIEKAQKMLLETEQDIKAIADSLGYLDPNYFTRVFKKTTGISPSEYRTKMTKG